MSNKRVENLVYKMLTENTGSHMLDSGGAYGRAWQRNAKKTIKDFRDAPSCWLEIEMHSETNLNFSPTISVFHYMSENLDLDDICDKFNKKTVENWDSEEFYGVSDKGEKFLLEHFDREGDNWNTYNWESNLSQVLQGATLKHKETGDEYILIQVHGGCDVRGGYTDAKLFKSDCGYFLSEGAVFWGDGWTLDWHGEWITEEGTSASDEYFQKIIKLEKITAENNRVVVHGDLMENSY